MRMKARDLILSTGCILGAVMLGGYVLMPDFDGNEAPSNASCSQMASEKQAQKLLSRLFPAAKIITAEELPLDNTKSVCLLEVEMLADAENPSTRGFVYVLPDGEQFLNGPLMDKRSQVSVAPTAEDIKKALEEQRTKLVEAFGPKEETPETMPLPPLTLGAEPPEQELIPPQETIAPQVANPEAIPTPAQLREKLLGKLQGLPGMNGPGNGKAVYAMIDPLCAHCKKLVSTSKALAEQHGVQFHWVPMFLNEGSWALSSLLLKVQKEDPAKAQVLLEQLMAGKLDQANIAEQLKTLTEADYAEPKAATAIFIELSKYNNRIGTPLVVFRKEDQSIEVISGMPRPEDWQGATSSM